SLMTALMTDLTSLTPVAPSNVCDVPMCRCADVPMCRCAVSKRILDCVVVERSSSR
ncbi:MAG: hypothetical protein ACI8RC_001845, partial [Ilumatobacter sp.]